MSSPDGSSSSERPASEPGGVDESLLGRFLTAESGALMFLREVLSSAGAVVAVGLLLFAVSGVWPPMVAVESGSMEPHMSKGDLVFITEPGQLAPDDRLTHGNTGVVTYRAGAGAGYETFGSYGSVVVYEPPAGQGPPIIHRTRFYVESGENWYDRADEDHVDADSCEALANCPAPHGGFITKGDANARYDQANGISAAGPVKPSWVVGVGRVRVPYLGWIRLSVSGVVLDATPTVTTPASASVPVETGDRASVPGVAGSGAAAVVTPSTAPTDSPSESVGVGPGATPSAPATPV